LKGKILEFVRKPAVLVSTIAAVTGAITVPLPGAIVATSAVSALLVSGQASAESLQIAEADTAKPVAADTAGAASKSDTAVQAAALSTAASGDKAAASLADDLPRHPYELVKVMTDRLLKKLERFQALESDSEKEDFARSVVDETFAAMIDFKLIARRVMAKHYKYASEAQRELFASTFRESLINTYALGMSAYSDQKVVIEPFAGIKEGKRKRAKVSMQIHAADGEVYPIEYALYENKEGLWLLENITLNGVNIGLTFRNQFNESLRSHKGSIDEVISNWSSSIDS
jgi:phospholipid transport system substrate-binding protein